MRLHHVSCFFVCLLFCLFVYWLLFLCLLVVVLFHYWLLFLCLLVIVIGVGCWLGARDDDDDLPHVNVTGRYVGPEDGYVY